jgi:hypothetical protein
MDSEEVALPFDDGQQKALVGHIMQHEEFFKQINKKIQPEWFTEPMVGKIYRWYGEFYDKFQRTPKGLEEFRGFDTFKALDQKDRLKAYAVLALCHQTTQTYGMDVLVGQLTEWQKAQLILKDLPQVANLLNSRQVPKAEALLHALSKELVYTRFEEAPVDFKNWRGLREASKLEVDQALSTGLGLLDRKLLPEGTKGSLLPGDTTVILAPTNAGKTSVMLTIARHNIVAGKSVLFITREGRVTDIQQKFFRSLFKKTSAELWPWTYTPEGEKAMDAMATVMGERLHYLHIPKVNAYVEETIGTIYRLQAARKAKYGKGYDLLVVDYPGIFQSMESKGARWEWRQIQDYLYRQFVQLGAEEKFHVLVAAQTNREGSKINKGYSAQRLLSVEDIAEAFGIAMSATNVITINRDMKSQAENRVTFYVVKSRSSEVGWAVVARSDYGRAITHSDELTATAYRGESAMADMVESLLKEYPNRDIPEGYMDGPHMGRPKVVEKV